MLFQLFLSNSQKRIAVANCTTSSLPESCSMQVRCSEIQCDNDRYTAHFRLPTLAQPGGKRQALTAKGTRMPAMREFLSGLVYASLHALNTPTPLRNYIPLLVVMETVNDQSDSHSEKDIIITVYVLL